MRLNAYRFAPTFGPLTIDTVVKQLERVVQTEFLIHHVVEYRHQFSIFSKLSNDPCGRNVAKPQDLRR